MTPTLLASLEARRGAKEAVVLATRVPDGAQFLLPAAAPLAGLAPATSETLADAARQAVASGRAATLDIDGETWFLAPHLPPPRLLVVGAVHIAQALVPLASRVGFEPIVIDPRSHFASPERFPGTTLVHDWPDDALRALAPDSQTAIVVLTHDPKLDDPALSASLGSDAFYIGVLGSRRTHAARQARLAEAGVNEAARARLRGPVGLAIGAVTPDEIALSILAEIVAVRRQAALGVR